MNLFKQQKFSIRKFNVGIFSALIATIAFLGVNPNSADAAEQDNVNVGGPLTENAVNQGQPTDQVTPNENKAGNVDPTTEQVSPQNTATQEQNQQQNDNQNAVETNNAPSIDQVATEVNSEANQPNAITDQPVNEDNQEQAQTQANHEKAQETPKENKIKRHQLIIMKD
ncbi:YSIRK-type signal peptide-containing protein [Staphylococcus warneri]|uniref:YSIRK-type signal peptide-containing protein n=1 Tax=Staphylococcus warneri TaxID=1292 RepID=UPI002413B8FB|nr:YSIRK-type signal peptide-containing protein [Staphylococcus warneri]